MRVAVVLGAVALVALLAFEHTEAAAPTCANGVSQSTGWTCYSAYKKCFKRGPSLVSWSSAQSYCSSATQAGFDSTSTGKLVEPSFSNGESSTIQGYVPSMSNADQQVIWTGVIRQSGSNWAYATTGTAVSQSSISPWGKNQPDWPTTGQSYLCLGRYKSWSSTGFDDGSPGALKFALCETPCTA